VRLLPDRPSIEFLRKEAKDLLGVLRESTPDASLADAQRALAAEYGVRDWPALRAEVERRVAELPAAPEGLAEELAKAFDLGMITAPARPISFTPMGRCWELTTDGGRWLGVTVFGWITEKQAALGARLRDAAVAAGVVAPVPARSARGRLIETVRDESWRVHEWIEVGPSPAYPVSTAMARRVGTTYATLHALAIPSDEPVHPYMLWRHSEDDWHQLHDRARAAGKPWAEQLGAILPVLAELRTVEADVPSDGLILCNRNLIPSNVRKGHDDELVVTEWDFSGSLTPELELGIALMHWVMRPSINPKAVAAFRSGYLEARDWPSLEVESFGVAVTSWLNWTYNTICEAIDPDRADRVEFAEREAIEVIKRPLTRSGLERVLEA
jgi:hypothetical protein